MEINRRLKPYGYRILLQTGEDYALGYTEAKATAYRMYRPIGGQIVDRIQNQ